jgi:hypothetical protein
MKEKINSIITALMKLESKGYHRIFFEYGDGLFSVKIYKGEVIRENIVYEKTVNPVREQALLDELSGFIENLNLHIKTTTFQCYRRQFIKDKITGGWEKTVPVIEFGENATQSMLIDGSGYCIDDPDNGLQYFVQYDTFKKQNN